VHEKLLDGLRHREPAPSSAPAPASRL